MKKLLTLLMILLLTGTNAFAANWLKVTEDSQKTYYIDTTSYQCNCANKSVGFRMKEVSKSANSGFNVYKMRVSPYDNELSSFQTTYNGAGKVISEKRLPSMRLNQIDKTSPLLKVMLRATYYCDNHAVCQ